MLIYPKDYPVMILSFDPLKRVDGLLKKGLISINPLLKNNKTIKIYINYK
jgi:hypothetical protein